MSEQTSVFWAGPQAKPGSIPSSVEDAPLQEGRLPFFFAWLFIVAIYLRPEDIFPPIGQLHLTLALGVCATATFLWAIFSGDVVLTWPRELRIVFLLTIWFAAGVPFAYWKGGSFDVLTQTWLKTVLMFFLLTQVLTTLWRIRAVLWGIILSELVVTAYSLAAPSARTTWQGAVGDRLSGVSLGFLYWNVFGMAIAITIPFMAVLFILKRSALSSAVLALTIGLASWMLVLTASRSGTMDVIFSILVTYWFVLRDTARGKIIGAAIALALLVTALMAPAIFWNRMSTLSGDDASNQVEASAAASTDQRRDVLSRSIDYTFQHPIFGLGLGNFGVANAQDYGGSDAWVASHNTFTEISSEAGIPGLILFLALLVTSVVSMRRAGRNSTEDPKDFEVSLMARATLASTLSLIFGIMFANITYEYFLYACPIAIAVAVHRISSERRNAAAEPPAARTIPNQQSAMQAW